MDPLTLNTVISTLGLVLVALIGAASVILGQKLAKIDEIVRVIKFDVNGKLEQILALSSRADLAEGAEIGRLRAIAEAAAVEAARAAVAEIVRLRESAE